MRLRVGIVGLGEHWETRHLPALRALADRFEVRGICEQVAARSAVGQVVQKAFVPALQQPERLEWRQAFLKSLVDCAF